MSAFSSRAHKLIRLLSLLLVAMAAADVAARPPNVVLIVVDDAAFMDFGGYGGEARTPSLDALGDAGVRFTNYHTSPLCAPSRAMLLTGIDNHLTGVATIPEVVVPEHQTHAGYTMSLLPEVETVASRLQRYGYRTYMTGKWHLGSSAQALPSGQGFQRSFALDASGADNFEQKPYMPYYETAPWFEDGIAATLPDDFYSSRFIVDKMIDYLNSGPSEQPFFAYLAFQAVHIPLQVPREYTDRYQGVYDAGWDALQVARWRRAVALGLVAADAPAPSRPPGLRSWDSLTAEEQRLYARSMQVNAGMLEAMDFHIGRLVEHLRANNEFDNTLFVVTSDNGPEFNDPLSSKLMYLWMAQNGYSHDYETLGERGSLAFIGTEWAAAASSPGSLFKFFSTEGGLRVPLIVAGPGVAGGRFSDAFTFVTDVTPSILELTGAPLAPQPGRIAITGRSAAGVLAGQAEAVHGVDDVIGMEVSGNTALFKGDRKLRRVGAPFGDDSWRMFDIQQDPAETQDLSLREPQRFAQLLADYQIYAASVGVIEMPAGFNVMQQLQANLVSKLRARYLPALAQVAALLVLVTMLIWWWRRQKR